MGDNNKKSRVVRLKRGGILVDTSIGYIQFGSPPETIKDTMKFEKGVPTIFVLTKNFFHREKGISVAEFEFPIYYNFFLKKKKTKIVCFKEDIAKFEIVLKESVFGPEAINLKSEFEDNVPDLEIPNIKSEMEYFRNGLELENLVEFVNYSNKKVKFDDVEVSILDTGEYLVKDFKYNFKVNMPAETEYKVTFGLGETLKDPFIPPVFGVTCLGPSHGFDPLDNTSGYIVWINNRGIMVDPPVNSTEWLKQSNVDPKYIDSIILTHTHADHDAGTFQKILEEEIVTIYSTETIMESFLRKYGNLTGISKKEMTNLFNYEPIIIGRSINIHGATFIFHYTLHSIPTINFRLFYRDKSFFYSSDHLNDPEVFEKLFKDGVISQERKTELLNFPWHYDYIYHEAGIPPLHTKVSFLNSLPVDVQKKITVYHIAKKDFPDDTYLKRAEFGIGSSLIIPVTTGPYEDAYRILDILSRIDIFKNFSIEKTKNLLAVIKEENISAGTKVIEKGSYGDKIYIILSGNFTLNSPNDTEDIKKRYGPYEYVGEASLILNQPRGADVWAETDVKALTINKSAFLSLIENTPIVKLLKKVALNRDEDSWKALSCSKLFLKMTDSQKTIVEAMLERVEIKEDTELLKFNYPVTAIYIFHSGDGEIIDISGEKKKLEIGDFVGKFYELQKQLPSTMKCTLKKGSLLFKLNGSEFTSFIKVNPGVYMRFFV